MQRAFIRAIVRANDGQTAEFDALHWLRQSSGEDVIALAKDNWSGEEAVAVAKYIGRRNRDVRAILKFCRDNSVAFEVQISGVDVDDWLRLNRPLVQDQLRART